MYPSGVVNDEWETLACISRKVENVLSTIVGNAFCLASASAHRPGCPVKPLTVMAEFFNFDGGKIFDAIPCTTAQWLQQPRSDKQRDVVGWESEHYSRLLAVQPCREANGIQQRPRHRALLC